MTGAIARTRLIFELAPSDHARTWRWLFGLMIFFLAGYVATAVLVFVAPAELLLFATGVVFAAGALFVFLVVRTGHATMVDLAERVASEERKSVSLERALVSTERLNESLSRSNRELEQFAYVASHDLQEPLRKVKAFGELLSTSYADELGDEGRMYIDRMHKASHRMSQLIDDLLTYSRLSRNEESATEVDLTATAEDVVSDLETRIASTEGQVIIGDLPTFVGRPVQMRQLLQNLLSNALKFHRDGVPPVVEVSGRLLEDSVHGSTIELTVKDNGIGFAAKHADRIFGIFQRLHGRSQYEGTGVGLSICQRIAERHGGSIRATGSEGEGATFVVTMPISKMSEAEAA